MNTTKSIMTIGGFLITAAVGLAQVAPAPAPLPPVAWDAPAPPPQVRRTPAPPVALPTPRALVLDTPEPLAAPAPLVQIGDQPVYVRLADQDRINDALQRVKDKMQDFEWTDQQRDVMNKAVKAMEDGQAKVIDFDWDKQQDVMNKAMQAATKAQAKMDYDWSTQQYVQDKLLYSGQNAFQFAPMDSPKAFMPFNDKGVLSYAQAIDAVRPKAPVAMGENRIVFTGGGDDRLYSNALADIDAHRYDQALASFNLVVSHAGARTEGALYWKAYVLNKLGKGSEAQAAIDQLRKTYASSRWLDDAKVLEVEIKQAAGKPVSPESETDEDIKIYALNGIMQSDPEKALPQVEALLKSSHSPKLKRNAVYVIATSNSPRAKQDLEQLARGGNPDLQLTAIRYLSSRKNDATVAPLFAEIYSASTDKPVKVSILSSFKNAKDKDRLLLILKTEKDKELRGQVISALGDVDGQPELWQIYSAETTFEGKQAILGAMQNNGNTDKLVEVAKTDTDPKVRQYAVRMIATQKTGNPSAAIASVYSSEQDEQVKSTIINNLANMRNAKALIDIARVEKDYKLKVRIVEHLSNMTKNSKEAADYLQELLSK